VSVEIAAYVGWERTVQLTVTSGGVPVDLSSVSGAWMDIRAGVAATTPAVQLMLGSGIAVTDAGSGQLEAVFVGPAEGVYVFDLFVDGVAALAQGLPLVSGVVRVLQPATRAA